MIYVMGYDIGRLPYNNYTIIDLETTGLRPNKDEIIEIACIKYKNNKEYDRFSTLVKPSKKLSTKIKNLTGITDSMLNNAPDFADVSSEVWDFLNGELLVGYNVKFDFDFLYNAFQKNNNLFLCNNYSDILKRVKSFIPTMPNYKLVTVAEYFQIDFSAHRAINDCEATYSILQKLTHLLINRDLPTLAPDADINSFFYDPTAKNEQPKDLKIKPSLKEKKRETVALKETKYRLEEMKPFAELISKLGKGKVAAAMSSFKEGEHFVGITKALYEKVLGIWIFTDRRLLFSEPDKGIFNEWSYDHLGKVRTDMGFLLNTIYFTFSGTEIRIDLDNFKLVYPRLKKYIKPNIIEEDKKTKKMLSKLNVD